MLQRKFMKMEKPDKSKFTKDEWRRVKEEWKLHKEEKRRQKEKRRKRKLKGTNPLPPAVPSIPTKPSPPPATQHSAPEYLDNYILCLKHGVKYSPEYVNKLYNMTQRYCNVQHQFYCLTEDISGLDPRIKTLPLPNHLKGWWCKPYIFSDLRIKGTILYLDLDVVISGNMDKLFSFAPTSWCVIRDFTRVLRPNWERYNSSVIRFQTGQLTKVWKDFEKDYQNIQIRLFGDQDWLYESTIKDKNFPELFPDHWVKSWKWEIRKSKEFAPGATKGHRKFQDIENVTPPKDCCICVFHGDPHPHRCHDPWIIKNWR